MSIKAIRKKVTFEVPAGTPKKSCMTCGKIVFWVVMPSGKKMPVNEDGTSHFADCKDAATFRGKTREEIRQGDLFGKGKA